MSLGWPEIVLILLVVLMLFGANRIPEIARSLGKATREFKKARDEFADELKNADSVENKNIAEIIVFKGGNRKKDNAHQN